MRTPVRRHENQYDEGGNIEFPNETEGRPFPFVSLGEPDTDMRYDPLRSGIEQIHERFPIRVRTDAKMH